MPNLKVGFLPDKGEYPEDQMASLRVFVERHVSELEVTSVADAELVFAHHLQADSVDKLKIVVERADSSTVIHARRFLKDRNVLGLFKHTLLPYELQNLPFCHRRYHITVLDDVYGLEHPREPLKPISGEEFSRIKCRGPIFMRYHRKKVPELNRFLTPLNCKRTKDIICKGSLQDNLPHVGKHRGTVIGKFGGKANRLLGMRRWHELLNKSKVCICPWGYGEMCYRDYEAMLSGCVVVKPNTDFVETWPRIYQAGKTYVTCAVDFSDIHEVCQEILDNYSDYQEMTALNREQLINPDFEQMGREFVHALVDLGVSI